MTYQQRVAARPSGWVGWILFAAFVLILNGMFTILQGLAGIFRDEAYFAGGQVLVFDYTAWGWIHLLLGIGLVAVGVGLYRGSMAASMVALVLVAIHLLAQFTWISAYPWWSLIAITLDVLIIYALIVHGDEMSAEA